MGFESFYVWLDPQEGSPLHQGQRGSTLPLTEQIQEAFPRLQADNKALSDPYRILPDSSDYLIFDQPEGLFTVALIADQGYTRFGLEFAYCNPRSVIPPFCHLIEHLMRRYQLDCHVGADLAPEQAGVSATICDPEAVCDTLIPSIEYNRHLWELDAETDQEAILRSGEAIARFIMPKINAESGTIIPGGGLANGI